MNPYFNESKLFNVSDLEIIVLKKLFWNLKQELTIRQIPKKCLKNTKFLPFTKCWYLKQDLYENVDSDSVFA